MTIRALILLACLLCALPPAALAQELEGERRRATVIKPPAAPEFPVSIDFALRGGAQWIVDPPRAKDDVFAFGALDVVVTAQPTPNVRLLLDLEALGGPGPDQALGTLSPVNADADPV